ncbi:V-set and immunoglobulin domain-containing protein 1 [Calliphora vicina]|uniref:V-set and immunoglobulin domain-containing protein 1 n=1 Tax=Calliphora vicina TaxID=7373 RepID=UPI00325A68DC
MYQNLKQQEQHHKKPRRPPSLTSLRLSYSEQQIEEQNYHEEKHHHNLYEHHQRNHHHQHRHHRSQHHHHHHHQKHKARHYFPRCGLIFLIFLSVIKESLTTTYSTSYSSSLDVTTTVSSTNLLPYFDFDVPRNITVTVGQTGFLHCRVERLGDKDVSWIRKRDLHILTAGSTTYTSDQRFQVLRPENSGNWTLQIKYPQPRDSGIYECQINTEPKMSLSYTFNVVELKATIIGPTDLYVKSGSDINLTCKIMQGPHELGNIFWYKGSEIIDMTTNQNEIDSGTRITVENDWSDGLTSRLKIRRASSSDTGNYTCVPTIAKSSSVYVHVIIGEHPAAMQHNSSNIHCGNFYITLCCMLFTILTCCLQHLMCTKTSSSKTAKTTTILATKKLSTSTPSLSMANANATSAFASVSASTSATKTTMQNTEQIPAVTKITQSRQHILSSLSSIKTTTVPSSAVFYSNTTTSASVAVAAKTPLLVRNGSISR